MKKIVLEHCIFQRIMDPIKGKAVIKQVYLSGLNKDSCQAGRSQGLSCLCSVLWPTFSMMESWNEGSDICTLESAV